MSRAKDARALQLTLAAETGADVEVRWDPSGSSDGWRCHVLWSDGPTVTAMRAHADRIGAGIGVLDVAELVFVRIVQPVSFAVATVRNVRLGQPALGGHRSIWLLTGELEDTTYPEQGSTEDLELARMLARLSNYIEPQMPAVLDHYGLDGLQAERGRRTTCCRSTGRPDECWPAVGDRAVRWEETCWAVPGGGDVSRWLPPAAPASGRASDDTRADPDPVGEPGSIAAVTLMEQARALRLMVNATSSSSLAGATPSGALAVWPHAATAAHIGVIGYQQVELKRIAQHRAPHPHRSPPRGLVGARSEVTDPLPR